MFKGKRIWRGLAVFVLLATGACGASEEDAPRRTDHERDSIIAQSRLPGAAGVDAAMRTQDMANAFNATIDSIAQSVP
ncbi:MAG: hypothetical protein ACC682_08885 [Gemmatimonadota bacterium]